MTTRQPSWSSPATCAHAPSTLPWNDGTPVPGMRMTDSASSATSTSIRPSAVAAASPESKAESVHHGSLRFRAASRSRGIVRKSPAPRSIGACAPEVAALQAASRNSRFVSPRVIARVTERSGSASAIADDSGR